MLRAQQQKWRETTTSKEQFMLWGHIWINNDKAWARVKPNKKLQLIQMLCTQNSERKGRLGSFRITGNGFYRSTFMRREELVSLLFPTFVLTIPLCLLHLHTLLHIIKASSEINGTTSRGICLPSLQSHTYSRLHKRNVHMYTSTLRIQLTLVRLESQTHAYLSAPWLRRCPERSDLQEAKDFTSFLIPCTLSSRRNAGRKKHFLGFYQRLECVQSPSCEEEEVLF